MTEDWQRRLDSLATRHGIVGASLAIHAGDQRVEAACGVLDKATDSLCQIGSITEVYTTTVAPRLTNGGPMRDLVPAIVAEFAGVAVPRAERPPTQAPAVDPAAVLGVYERVKLRFEAFRDGGVVRLRMTGTAPLADPEPPEVVELVPAAPGRFLTRTPGERRCPPVVFHRLADGHSCVHCGGRVLPKRPEEDHVST